jgi:hypothetical protein
VLPRPDAVVERLRPDVIHFMKHRGWRTRTPNVYVPHDLQHVDLPHHFHPVTRAYRSGPSSCDSPEASPTIACSTPPCSPGRTRASTRTSSVSMISGAPQTRG